MKLITIFTGKRYAFYSEDLKEIYDVTKRIRSAIMIPGFFFVLFPSLYQLIPKYMKDKLFKIHKVELSVAELRKLINVSDDIKYLSTSIKIIYVYTKIPIL